LHLLLLKTPDGTIVASQRSASGEYRVISRRMFVVASGVVALVAHHDTTASAQPASFRDPMLKLFVVAELMRLKRLDLGPYEAFHERLLGRRHDYRVDGFKANPKALEYFERLSIDAADLALVEWLDLDGGNPIFQYIDPNWQGYTEGISEIRRLDDIALLPNLLYFGAAAFLPTLVDFSLFRPLAKLTRLNATIDEYSNLETLTALPALTQLELMGNRICDDVTTVGHPARKVMDILRARGVKLAIIYVSRSFLPGKAPPPAFH
jgi:hypothetical protein